VTTEVNGSGAGTEAPASSTSLVGEPVVTSADTVAAESELASGPISTGTEWSDVTANLVGLESDCGNLAFVSGHPQTNQVVAGVALHGLWELNDAGDEWARLGTAVDSAPISNRTTSVLFDPEAPERFWQSGSYAVGAFRTDDGGGAFAQLGAIEHLDYVSVDFTDPFRRTMLAGGHERNEIYRSVTGGQDWISLAPNLPAEAGFASYPFVIDSATHLLGTNSGERSGIFRTTDGGTTWSLVLDVPVSSPPVVVGGAIYWLVADGGGVVVSIDQGATFTRAGEGTGGAPQSLVALPGGVLASYNDENVLVSDDAGASWTAVGPSLPYVPWGLAYSEQRQSLYVWRFTCAFNAGEPVTPMSIMQIDASIGG